MRIAVFGLGYVGLVTAACLAERGHDVTGIDIDGERLQRLRLGRAPFFEPGLDEMVERHHATGRLRFATGTEATDEDLAFVAVGTHDGAGGWQTRTILECLEGVVPTLRDDAALVVRSTLPPDFAGRLGPIVDELRREAGRPPVPLLINPEFTREGTAIHDFLEPDRVVLGVFADPRGTGIDRLTALYEPFNAPIVVMTGTDAVLTKLGSNLFLATRISFANELAGLCEAFGANIEHVVEGMGHDRRIGSAFFRPGVGFGGSCLPNQVSMTVRAAAGAGVPARLLAAVEDVNLGQRERFVGRLRELVGGELRGLRIALLGLTFKPDTDDLRDAPSLEIARLLIDARAEVVAYDPMSRARRVAAELVPELVTVDSPAAALRGADVAGLVTEWPEFSVLDWAGLAPLMKSARIVDGRNALDASALRAAGFTYLDFGRSGSAEESTVRAPGGPTGPNVEALIA